MLIIHILNVMVRRSVPCQCHRVPAILDHLERATSALGISLGQPPRVRISRVPERALRVSESMAARGVIGWRAIKRQIKKT